MANLFAGSSNILSICSQHCYACHFLEFPQCVPCMVFMSSAPIGVPGVFAILGLTPSSPPPSISIFIISGLFICTLLSGWTLCSFYVHSIFQRQLHSGVLITMRDSVCGDCWIHVTIKMFILLSTTFHALVLKETAGRKLPRERERRTHAHTLHTHTHTRTLSGEGEMAEFETVNNRYSQNMSNGHFSHKSLPVASCRSKCSNTN